MGRQYHLVGIGGIGMSGVAHLLLERGYVVSGSELKESAITDSLRRAGARIAIGHDAGNVGTADAVVYSSAIKDDNPEIMEARARNIPLIKRAQALYELMGDAEVITVAGSHGKTTTTSLVSHLLIQARREPTVVIGGILKNIGSNAAVGKGAFFVAEADESDGSFLYYRPTYSIITNIDREHLDHYKDFDAEVEAFGRFIAHTRKGGLLFYCHDDLRLRSLAAAAPVGTVSFGLSPEADWHAERIVFEGLSASFDCFYRKEFLCRFRLALGGAHNVSNALAVIALARALGIEDDAVSRALATFQGSGRRLEVRFSDSRLTIIDDYAHHPTEIAATLDAVRHLRPRRLIAVFQPHRYSRTQLLLEDFGACFALADRVVLTDIYAASETPLPGICGARVADAVKAHHPGKPVDFVAKEDILKFVRGTVEPGDLILMLGAGDITKVSDALVKEFGNAH